MRLQCRQDPDGLAAWLVRIPRRLGLERMAAWVSAAKSAGLQAVALTDHNTPNGIPGIQTAAVAAGDLTVLPGVEVTVGGIHILCNLDGKCSRDDVVALPRVERRAEKELGGADHAAHRGA